MFENTEISFHSKSEKDLKKSKKLFQLLKNRFLVKLGKVFLQIAILLRIPINSIIKTGPNSTDLANKPILLLKLNK